MSTKRPTQADVARVAGVSRATVSYVLNDQGGQLIPISPETRRRVLDAVSDLGYRVDARAQSLRSGDTRTIGVLLPMYENPFFWEILVGISREAEASGYSVLLSHSAITPEQEDQSIRDLAEQRVDGLLLLAHLKELPEGAKRQLRESQHPVVQLTDTPSEFDYVRQGYGEGARVLMGHLVELGHTRIAFLHGVASAGQGADRMQAYRDVIRESGLDSDESLLVHCGPLMADAYLAAQALLSRADRPTAIVTINDLLAMATIRAAADLGLRVPDDVSVAGFDDIPFASYTVPRLTTVSATPEQNGRDAVRLLLQRRRDPSLPQQIVVSGWQLQVRESTGPAPKENRL